MPRNSKTPNEIEEELESFFEIFEQAQAQILARIDDLRLQPGQNSEEWERRLALMSSGLPVKSPYL